MADLNWLTENNFDVHIAGRSTFSESESVARIGYADLIAKHRWKIDATNPAHVMLFPEMNAQADVQFETGKTLQDSLGPVALNHPHCAKFCVLGGASCSA